MAFLVCGLLALALLMTRVSADHSHDAAPADYLAVLADATDACFDLHDLARCYYEGCGWNGLLMTDSS